MIARADAVRLPLRDRSVALTCGSPPYCDARTYGIGAARGCREWVTWMLWVTAESLRVTDGPVIWIAAGVTRDRTYWPACEGLMWRWFSEGWSERGPGTIEDGSAYRPCYWHRVGIPGSGGDQWYRSDVEYAMCFKRPGPLPHADPKANGHAPKWAPGGEMSHRVKDGHRRNQWGKHANSTNSQRRPDGTFQGAFRPSHVVMTRPRDGMHSQESTVYVDPAIANPGCLIHTNAGGNQLGHEMAHDNEAPYPLEVPSFFINSHSRPDDLIHDPFSGSGSTWDAAKTLGRRFIGFDIRASQCDLSRRRVSTVTAGLPFAS